MTHTESPINKALTLSVWRFYSFLGLIQGVIVLIILLRTPSESESGFFLGLSLSRLLIIGAIFSITLMFAWVLIGSWRNPNWFEKIIGRLDFWLERSSIWGSGVLISLLGLFGGIYFAALAPEVTEPFARAYFDRLLPLAFWISGLSAQTLVALSLTRYGFDPRKLVAKGKPFALFLAILGLFLFMWSWVVRTQFENESHILGWNDLGIPILETQVLLAWIAGMAMLAFILLKQRVAEEHRRLNWFTPRRVDLIVGLTIWLAAVVLWGSTPITPNWFVSEPRQPNFEFYPNSDTLSYDTSAQILLVGEGLQFVGTPFVRRPVHALFLTLLHLIGGQDYERVVFLQILILGTLPVFIYFLTKALHTRVSAVIAAVLITLREMNSIAIAGTITASHAKSLMADLPATLGVVCFVYVMVIWLQDMKARPLYPLLAGGLLGIPVLIRPETGILLIAAIFVLILLLRKRPLQFLLVTSLLVLGLALILFPWIWRNWKLTGLIFLDSPSFRFNMLEERYKTSEELFTFPEPKEEPKDGLSEDATAPSIPGGLPAEATAPPPTADTPSPGIQLTPQAWVPVASPEAAQPTEEITYEGYVSSVAGQTIEFIRQNAPEVISFVSSQFMNSQLQIVLILPTSVRAIDSSISFLGHRDATQLWKECCSLRGYARRLPFWHKWDGVLPGQAILPLAMNVFLILLGIYRAWKDHRLVGLTPLIFGFSHLFINALFRNSGGRYILPVDWIGIMYYSIGLAQTSRWGMALFTDAKIPEDFSPTLDALIEQKQPSQKQILRSPGFYALAVAIFLLGCTLPLAESSFQPRYTEDVRREMIDTFLLSEQLSEPQRASLQTFLLEGGKAIAGRALYPRYYGPDEGEPGSKVLKAKPYPRLGFYLAGPESRLLVIPIQGRPSYFPNASDVLVIGCPEMDVLVVSLFDSSGSVEGLFGRYPLPPAFSCPFPPIEDQIGDNS